MTTENAAVRPSLRFARHLLAMLLVVTICTVTMAQEESSEKPANPDELKIEGIVVDNVGSGVADAEVRIELPTAATTDAPLAKTQTGTRGQIEITLKRPKTDELRVRITREGFAEHVSKLDISDPSEPPFIDATLTGAARISGKVLTAATLKPIATANIQCNNGGRQLTTQPASDGRYSFDAIYAGPATLIASAEGYATRREVVDVQEPEQHVDLPLDPERLVELTIITNTIKPADDITVEAITEPGRIKITATSDYKGKVELHGVSPDTAVLRLRLNGPRYLAMRTYDEQIDLPEPPATNPAEAAVFAPFKARLTVTLAGRIRGRVVDKTTNQPIDNVRVFAGREMQYSMPVDWTDAEGNYELTGVRPGVVTVTFQDNAHATSVRSVDLNTGSVSTLDAALDSGVAIGGIVVDDQGLPVDQVRVVGDHWNEFKTLGLRTITGGDGRFHFPHVPAGEIEFTFVRPGYGAPKTELLEAGKTDHKIMLEGTAVPLTSGSAPVEETKLKPGQIVPDLVLTATDGKVYKLSDLQGKYVMIDCWASWCRPCLAEIPHVKAVYDAAQGRTDFILIGISLDTDAKAMKKACQDNGIVWPQALGPKSGASEAFEALDGVGIPYTCLIGPDGKLIVQHLRGAAMVEQVKKQLPPPDKAKK